MISELRPTRLLRRGRHVPRGLERRPQSSNASQCAHEVRSPRVTRRKTQSGNPARSHQLGRYHEQALAKTLQGGPPQMRWDTETFEPVQQVVRQQDNLEERLVGLEVLRRNLPQGVGVLQFSDDQFRPRATSERRVSAGRFSRLATNSISSVTLR